MDEEVLAVCPHCNARFECGAMLGEMPCWCAKLPHVLPCSGTDAACFCPECLSEAMAGLVGESESTE